MRICIATILACICLILSLVGCASKYNAEDFIGKTSAEIINKYGPFDCTGMPESEYDLYRNCRCGYMIRKTEKSFFGTSEEMLFFIRFDENGIAT